MKQREVRTWPDLEILKPSRKPVRPGDIFVLKPVGYPYCFGRVIRTDAKMGGSNKIVLCYIYAAKFDGKDTIPDLSRDRLLIPPILTGRVMWTYGDFETIAHRELRPEDVLPVHCFHWSGDIYFNEDHIRLEGPTDPVGSASLWTSLGISHQVCEALEKLGYTPETTHQGVPARDVAPRQPDDQPPEDESEDANAQQAVIVYLRVSRGRRDETEDDDLYGLEERLTEAIQRANAGFYDGDEIGPGEVILYMYGPDADKLFAAVEPSLRTWRFTKGHAIKQYGPPGARESRVELESERDGGKRA